VEHAVVLAEHVGLELRDAVRAGDAKQVLEQDGTDPAALVLVGDGEGDLRTARILRCPRVASDADDVLGAVLAKRRDDCGAVVEVEVRELVQLRVAQPPLRAEEAEVDGARAQAMEVLDEAIAVLGPDRPDVDRASVAKDLLRGVLAEISDRARLARGVGVVNLGHTRSIRAAPEPGHRLLEPGDPALEPPHLLARRAVED
jgi:hypothetical protein